MEPGLVGRMVSVGPTAATSMDGVEPGQGQESDERLVEAARVGDVGAFEALYRLHVGKVYGLCQRMVSDPALAEDLTQEAFVRAWTKLSSFEGRSAFASWLHRIAVNVVLGHVRQDSRWAGKMTALEDAPARPIAVDATPPSGAIDVEKALDSLPPRARLVFVLHEVQGFRHQEIGHMLDMAPGTSKAHLHRARRLLREALQR